MKRTIKAFGVLSFCAYVAFQVYILWLFLISPVAQSDEKIIIDEENITKDDSEPSIKHSFKGDGVSACLLVKDDNSRLIEWLAYHYHTLPLRHLILAVDPDSKTSPLSVLQRWTDSELDYIIWDDEDFITAPNMKKMKKKKSEALKLGLNLSLVELHRERQKTFISRCYNHYKLMNHSWVLHVDTDEYVVFNTISDDEPAFDGVLGPTLRDQKSKVRVSPSNKFGRPLTPNLKRKSLPKIGQKTILEVINETDQGPCIGMYRLLFSAVDATDLEMEAFNHYPPSLDRKNFDTLRYLRHHVKGDLNFLPNGLGKMLVDVSRLPNDNLVIFSIHRPFKEICPTNIRGPKAYAHSIFRVNHYLGSWKAYSSRSDVRRDRNTFDTKANATDGPSFEIIPWLESFVEEVGEQKAQYLLQNVA